MKWFGRPGGAPYEADTEHVPTPVGALCLWCNEPIAEGDDGILMPYLTEDGATEAAYHYECQLRSVIGGLNHLRGNCICCGGSEDPDPPEMTRREAARAAVDEWQRRRRLFRV